MPLRLHQHNNPPSQVADLVDELRLVRRLLTRLVLRMGDLSRARATPAAPPEPEKPAPPSADGPAHSDDFCMVKALGQAFRFTPSQAVIVRCLWDHHERGTPEVRQDFLLELDDRDRSTRQLRDLFRSRGRTHPAWRTLIVPGGRRGTFRLNLTGQEAHPAV